jgi:predicted Zn-dependent peptidase
MQRFRFRRAILAAILPLLTAAPALAGHWVHSGIAADTPAPKLVPVVESGSPGLFTFECANGLPGVVDARPGTRTVFLEIGVRAGSRDEPDGHAGLAHLLEHLMFKEGHGGEDAAGARANPAFSGLRAVGAEINASTDFELTEYHADVPADRFEEGWRALEALVSGTGFDAADVERERDVVLQEVALGKTDPLAIMAYSVLRKVFPGDPIGQPVIGFRKTLEASHYEDARAFADRYYVPANMFVVITGDVDPAAAAGLVAQTLGSRPAGTARPPRTPPRPVVQPLYRFRTLVSQSYLLAGAITDGENGKDAPALQLLATVLGQGHSSRLHRRLVERDAFTDEVLAISFLVSDTGAIGCGGAVAPKDTQAARAALLEEIARLTREDAGQDEVDSARARVRAGLLDEFETNEGRTGFRQRRLLLGQDVSLDAHLARLDALTPADLRAVASRTLGARPVEIQVLPARGPGKLLAALKFLIFRRL